MWWYRSIHPLNVSSKGIDGMAFLNQQGQLGNLWFARASYLHARRSKSESIVVFIAIVLFHLVLIFIALNVKSKQREAASTPSFKMIYLSPQKPSVELEVRAPSLEFSPTKVLKVPEIVIEENSASIISLETPPSNSLNNTQVFDPKMRQKLIDAQILNKVRIKGYLNDWKESDGRDFLARGDGECFVSMRQVDSRDRGKNWGSTRCGKTDSESMIDRVNADFESRKNPLKTQ